MAAEAARHAPALCGDAQSLPLRATAFDVVLCPHMLYHVPDQAAAVAEVRRALRPRGQALFVTNSVQHFRQVDDMVAELLGAHPMRLTLAFTMEDGAAVLRTSFTSVTEHLFSAALDVTDAEAVVDYLGSVREFYGITEEHLEEVRRRVGAAIERDGAFEVSTASGVFVCS
jgi:ubiquinone/menaquinone biosynthesis C-methylase UbiE